MKDKKFNRHTFTTMTCTPKRTESFQLGKRVIQLNTLPYLFSQLHRKSIINDYMKQNLKRIRTLKLNF